MPGPWRSSWKVVLAEDWQNGGFGLYIHWPFCQAKCPYCDFNSHVVREIDQTAWAGAYLAELERVAAEVPGRVLNTIFFGGGTPSLMAPETVHAIIEAARRHWPTSNDMEITLEANPGSVEAGRFSGYRGAGVNRVSLGIQALNDTDLRRLGRIHTVAEARTALQIARNCFDRVSFDLICARQDQSVADWRAELGLALELASDHLSLYQLTVEDGTAFGDRQHAGRLKGLPSEDRAADIHLVTQEICEAQGMPAYEVSNHAREGAESRHNLIYWRYGDYLGIGPGAHGRITIGGQKYATESHRRPDRWLAAVKAGNGYKSHSALGRAAQANEFLMMGLRISEGIDLERFNTLGGEPIAPETIARLSDLGVVRSDGKRLRATDRGRMVLNAVISEFLLP